jgi:hypothetical protein
VFCSALILWNVFEGELRGSRVLEIPRQEASIRLSLPYILGSGCADHGFPVSLRIRLDVALRVSQEREEIFTGSEGFDGLALQRAGAGEKRDEPKRQWAR